MTTFPIELIPHQIQQAKLAQPSVPQCSAIEPRPPADFREIETPLPGVICINPLKGGISIFIAEGYQFLEVDTTSAQLAHNR